MIAWLRNLFTAPVREVDWRALNICVNRFQQGVSLRIEFSESEELIMVLPRAAALQLLDALADALGSMEGAPEIGH